MRPDIISTEARALLNRALNSETGDTPLATKQFAALRFLSEGAASRPQLQLVDDNCDDSDDGSAFQWPGDSVTIPEFDFGDPTDVTTDQTVDAQWPPLAPPPDAGDPPCDDPDNDGQCG